MISVLFSQFANAGFEDETIESLRKLTLGSQRTVDGADGLPRYVLVILSRDTFDDEDGESDGESDEEFTDACLERSEGLYRANRFSDGDFSLYDKAAKLEEVKAGPAVSARVGALAIKLAQEAFGREAAESIQAARARMKVVVLSNRVKSVSRSRRYEPHPLDTASINVPTGPESHIEVAELHFHLMPQWRERQAGNDMRITDLEKVSRFFRALKRYEETHGFDINADDSGARRFRKAFEDDIRHLVPFHSMRNAVKNHPLTVNGVVQFYATDAASPVYFAFFDDDFDTLRPEGRGLFSVYDDVVLGQRVRQIAIPSIMSTGYRFGTNQDIAMIASEIDRMDRSATASVIPNAPCYPEPNFLILAHLPRTLMSPKVIDADFDSKQDTKTKTESRSFIKEAYRLGDATAQTTHFLPFFPMHTATPPRVCEQIRKAGLRSEFSPSGRLSNWGEPEIKFLRDMSQSHMMPFDWAKGVVPALPLSSQITPASFGFEPEVPAFRNSQGRTIDKIAVSAVSRMFNAYLPIAPELTDRLSKAAKAYARALKDKPRMATNTNMAFRTALLAGLLSYGSQAAFLLPFGKVKAGTSNFDRYVGSVKSTNDIAVLRLMLAGIFSAGAIASQQIEEAAKRAGQAIRDGILHYFDFGADSQALAKARRGLPVYIRDHMNYEYTEQDVRRLLRLAVGVAADAADPNEIVAIGANRYLFPPIGAFGPDNAIEVLQQQLQQHVEANQQDQVIAIPFHLGAHWVGIIVRIETTLAGRKVSIKYVDSLEPDFIMANDVSEAMRNVLAIYFPGAEINFQSELRREQTDMQACGVITVENLLDSLLADRAPAPEVMTPDLTLALRQGQIARLNAVDLALDLDGPALFKKKSTK